MTILLLPHHRSKTPIGPTPYLRERAHVILLRHRGYSLEQIADVLGTQYQTISLLDRSLGGLWIQGLYKSHGGGVTATFSAEEVECFKELVKEEPRRIRHAKAVLEDETKKTSLSTLRRMAKNLGMVFKHAYLQQHLEQAGQKGSSLCMSNP